MKKEELVQRSPVRSLEKLLHGGLKTGEIGIISSPSGLGKTSVLVQIALDKLLQDKKIIHVSFTQQTSYVLAWYDDIFNEFTQKKNLDNSTSIRDDLVKNRIILNFNQDTVTSDTIQASLKAMITEGGFNAEAIIIDGFDFSKALPERISNLKDFARESGLSLWYSCTVKDDTAYDKRGIPTVIQTIENLIDVVIVLNPKVDHIKLSVTKDRGAVNTSAPELKLDPKTLLIAE
jgi:hypothetical protein